MNNGSWENIYVNQGRVQLEILSSVVEAVKVFKSKGYKDILDLGCGTGRHTYYLAHEGFKVSACDISEKGLEITEKLLTDAGFQEVNYSKQDMYSLTLDKNSFDGVLCIWVQGHGTKQQVEHGVKEIHKILKDGGTVITDFVTVEDDTYGVGEEIAPQTFVGGRPGEEGIPHYYATKEELKVMFGDFSDVRMEDIVYRFSDKHGKEYKIVAVVVEAVK